MDYEEKAIEYSEKYGIVDYEVDQNKMIYYSNYPKYLAEPRRTYKVVVNLDTQKEELRTLLKRWSIKGQHNRYK